MLRLPGHDDEDAMVKLVLVHGAEVMDGMVSALENSRPILIKLSWDSGGETFPSLVIGSVRVRQPATCRSFSIREFPSILRRIGMSLL
jgi:hypothetical protein